MIEGVSSKVTVTDDLDNAIKVLQHMHDNYPGLIQEVHRELLKGGFQQFYDAYHRTLQFLKNHIS